jgi:glycogen operon protein
MPAERASVSVGQAWPLGATAVDGGVNVAVVSRHAERIFVCLFDGDDREVARLSLPGRTDDDIHHGLIGGAVAGMRYGLRADGPHDPAHGHRFDPAKLLVDPYATQLDRPFAWHPELAAPRSAAIDTAPLVPKAIVPALEPKAARMSQGCPGVIYEIAVKAFTKRHPDVPPQLRGTVAALALPRVIDHLLKIGIDTVELMPLAAWIDERHLPPLQLRNAWGYNPVTLMAPDPRLAPGGFPEIRGAVAALHDAGIRVLLDIVLNHTGESDEEGPTLSLRGLDNALYYRHAEGDPGKLLNHTGCGNTLAVERAPVVRLAMDALRSFADKTGIDGFRFDLAAVLGRVPHDFSSASPLLAAITQDPLLSGLTLIAEPWDTSPGGYRLGQFSGGWHEWNDRYRDDVRRFWRDPEGSVGALATRLAGSSDIFGRRRPSRSVNYVAAHDGFTLRDLVSYRSKHNLPNGEDNRDGGNDDVSWNHGAEGPTADAGIEERRRRDVRALLATLMVSRGTPMLTAGDELGRTQRGNNNAYAQDNETTWLDWDSADVELPDLVSALTRLRRSHRAISADRFLSGEAIDGSGIPDAAWLAPEGRPMTDRDWAEGSVAVLGLALYAAPAGAIPADRVCIWINRGMADAAASPPPPRPGFVWRAILDSSRNQADLSEELRADSVVVPCRAIVALAEAVDARRAGRSKSDDELIDRLAAVAGIKAEWWQVDGSHHRVTSATMRALLEAMRLPAQTPAEASETLVMLRREREARPLPLVHLSASGLPGSMRLAVPERQGERPVSLSISIEGSGMRQLRLATGELREMRRVTVGSETIRHLAVPLPALPLGYHEAVLDEDPERRCRIVAGPSACFLNESLEHGARLFGLTSHLYATRHSQDVGMGDLETLSRFCEAVAKLGGSVAGINPLHHLFPTDRGRASPYQPSDRRFIDPIYIDLAAVVGAVDSSRGRALLQQGANEISHLRRLDFVDYPGVWRLKHAILAAAFADFEDRRGSPAMASLRHEFEAYQRATGPALRRHATFEALAEQVGSVDPGRWPTDWRIPDSAAVVEFAAAHAPAVDFRIWLQWIAERQLAAAAKRAGDAGLELGIYRDLALGAAADGGETWASRAHFARGVSLGAPPDPFARDGQVWQLSAFEPHALMRAAYQPFIDVLAANMRHAGILRIDHILGYARQFWVPAGAPGGDGAYVEFPLDVLIAITAIESRRARCTVIGEDLGTVPDGLRDRLADARILSYRVLWFERDGETFRSPDRYPPLSASCVSSHDLPTFIGWRHGRDIHIERETGKLEAEAVAPRLARRRGEEQRLREAMERAQLQPGESDVDLMTAAHELIARTPSLLAFVQADDLFEEQEPINVPGTDRERRNWRRRHNGPIEAMPARDVARRVVAAVKRGRDSRAPEPSR